MMRWRILAWLASLVCLACSEPRVADPGARPIQQTTFQRLNASPRRVDLLFVIDNSASMAAKQAHLLESLSTMMGALEKLDGGLPDVHIGVVSSDLGAGMGEAPMMRVHPACVTYPLIDSDPNTPDIQPDCQVSMMIAGDESGACGGEPAHEVSIPECADVATGLPVNPANPRPQLDSIPEDRRPCWYFLHDRDDNTGCPRAFEYQKIAFLLRPDQIPPPGATWTATCWISSCPPVNGQRCE